MKLPALLGYMATGLLFSPGISEILTPLQQLSFSQSELISSGPFRLMALFIILYRAGLGLDKAALRENGHTALKLSFTPCLAEACAITLFSHYALGFLWIESALLAFIIAAVSPAVIVPMMLKLQEDKIGTGKKIPTLILASVTLDDILAITGFGVCLALLSINSTEAPLAIIIFLPFAIVTGIAFGWLLIKPLKSFLTRPEIHVSLKVAGLLILALILKNIEESNLFPFSYLLAIMTFGFAIRDHLQHQADELAKAFQNIWKVAEVVLFVLIGAMVDLRLVAEMGLEGLILLTLGLSARSIGVYLSLNKSKLNLKEKFFCVIAYLPKATVQATIGGIALSYFYDGQIKLYQGAQMGEFIVAMAAMSIVITAPLGAIGIRLSNQRLLTKEN
ncbi:MAG: cation:proton antiporter [Lentisphaerales bacterium]|nr:cation:proton antiporter [Lentisphaerales bacterium]